MGHPTHFVALGLWYLDSFKKCFLFFLLLSGWLDIGCFFSQFLHYSSLVKALQTFFLVFPFRIKDDSSSQFRPDISLTGFFIKSSNLRVFFSGRVIFKGCPSSILSFPPMKIFDLKQKQVSSKKDASEVRGKHRNAEKVRADMVVYCRFFPYFFAGHLQFICRLDGWTDSPAKQSRSQSITFSAIL